MPVSRRAWTATKVLLLALLTSTGWAQAVAGPEKARTVQGDPGISSMVVLDRHSYGPGAGRNKKEAEQNAAALAFAALKAEAVTVRCLESPDGGVATTDDDPDSVATVGRSY